MRRHLTWLVAAPLAAAGLLSAHALGYRLMVSAGQRSRVLQESGHSYLRYAPLLLPGGLALVVIGLAVAAVAAAHGRGHSAPRSWPFALYPLVAFALQEHLERLLHSGAWPLQAALQPTFLVGLLLQVPFGLFAYLLVRLLLRLADGLGRALAAGRPPRLPLAQLALAPAPGAGLRPAFLAREHAGRGPPTFSLG